jgi:cytoskeletal protein CcmA (bactofilin family)
MQGNLKAPRIAMADGAIFGGKVEMPGAKAVAPISANPAPAHTAPKLEPVGV